MYWYDCARYFLSRNPLHPQPPPPFSATAPTLVRILHTGPPHFHLPLTGVPHFILANEGHFTPMGLSPCSEHLRLILCSCRIKVDTFHFVLLYIGRYSLVLWFQSRLLLFFLEGVSKM